LHASKFDEFLLDSADTGLLQSDPDPGQLFIAEEDDEL
jgi:hypothetical protein